MNNRQDSEIQDIIEGFQMLGCDSGGLVNPNDLREIMDIMNMSEKNPFIYNIILNLCSNQEIQEKGGIDAKDFIEILNKELDDSNTDEGLQNLFSIFSNYTTNTIAMPTFSQIIEQGDNFKEEGEKLKSIISKPEINRKEMDFNEFQDIMKSEIPKQASSQNKNYRYNEEYNNNKDFEDNINKVEINFDSNIINANSNYNSINLQDSFDLSEKNSEKYSNGNKAFSNENNRNMKYSYKKPKPEKIYYNENHINNKVNNNFNLNFDEVNNFDNVKINKNKNEEEVETVSTKKKYRHMRKPQNKESQNEKPEEEMEMEGTEDKEMKYSMINKDKHTKGRMEYINDNSDKNNNGDIDNEEKSDVKTERRYHRRYRDIKSATPDKKEEKNKGENNKNFSGYSKYRKKK